MTGSHICLGINDWGVNLYGSHICLGINDWGVNLYGSHICLGINDWGVNLYGSHYRLRHRGSVAADYLNEESSGPVIRGIEALEKQVVNLTATVQEMHALLSKWHSKPFVLLGGGLDHLLTHADLAHVYL